jgi:hypothetical protein
MRKTFKLALLNLLISIAGLASPELARAQYLGNISMQTVSQTLANGATCTGSSQVFVVTNLGQTSHLATAVSGASQFQMEIDGVDRLSNVFRLSDLQLGVPSSARGGVVVTAAGYMPIIQANVTCTAGATFSVTYSGSFSPQPPNLAGALLNAVDKLPFQTAAANTNSSTTFQTPSGNSAGTIIFQYSGVGPVGSTISAQCLSNAGTNLTLFTFNPTTSASPQLFSVPSGPCPFVNLTYTSGGASAVTYNLEYVFVSQGSQQTTQTMAGPLQPATTKNTETTSAANAAQTVSIAGVASQKVYLMALAVRASAATPVCGVTVKDGVGGTIIWTSDANFVSNSTRTVTWTVPLASSSGNGMDIVVSACGVGLTSTLDVEASQL